MTARSTIAALAALSIVALASACSAGTAGSQGPSAEATAAPPSSVSVTIPDDDPLQFPGYDVDRVTIAPLPTAGADITIPALTGWDAFDESLRSSIVGGGSQSASVAVSIDGDIVHTAAFGSRAPLSLEPAETIDRFRVASISKSITTIAMLQLVEEGVIGLDDPVGAMIAEHVGVGQPSAGSADITVRQLLTHTSGFAQYENLFFRNQVDSCEEAAQVGFTRSLSGTPGGGYRYSNMNFCVAGLLIERLTGQPYEEVVYERLLTPLGISGMRLAGTHDNGPDEIQHRSSFGRNYMEVLGAAGAWIATPSDLVTIFDSLDVDKPGWKPLEPETVAEMRTSVIDPRVPDRGYGMGLILYGDGNFGHTGTVESTHAMVLDRSDNVTWAVTVAGENPSDTPRLASMVDRALVAGGFIAAPVPEEPAPVAESSTSPTVTTAAP